MSRTVPRRTLRPAPQRRARGWSVGAVAALLAGWGLVAGAQEPAATSPAPAGTGVVTASPLGPLGSAAGPTPAAPLAAAMPPGASTDPPSTSGSASGVGAGAAAAPLTHAAVRVFIEGCVRHEGALTAVVDWALTQGFEPLDASDEGARTLLDGGYGAVLAARAPAEPVLLAVSADGRCTVWAERAPGPLVHQALLLATSQLAKRGRLQLMVDRTVERAGAWRRHVQWRYRRAGGAQDWALGAVTTLGEAPSAQALQLARLPAASGFDPDGQPR